MLGACEPSRADINISVFDDVASAHAHATHDGVINRECSFFARAILGSLACKVVTMTVTHAADHTDTSGPQLSAAAPFSGSHAPRSDWVSNRDPAASGTYTQSD